MFAFQFLITVLNGMLQEPVLLVIKVMISLKDNAQNQPFNNQLIWDVKLGIGTDKYALNAQPDGLSIQREFVFQLLIIVLNGIIQELALHVIKDIKFQRVNVLNHQLLFQLIWDVKLGIGTNKFVLNVLMLGHLIQKVSVFQFQINVNNGITQEPVHHASKDIN